MMSGHGTDCDGTLVRVHTHTGTEGVIVELRPEDHPAPFEQDMQDLTDSEALDLYRQLEDYLRGRGVLEQNGSTSLGGGFCYGCASESDLKPAVVDGKDVLICQSCNSETADRTSTGTDHGGDR